MCWCVENVAEGYSQSDVGAAVFGTKEEEGKGVEHAVSISFDIYAEDGLVGSWCVVSSGNI